MLVLCSNGLTSQQLVQYISEKTARCQSAALVVTADNIYKEHNYHVERCIRELEALNLSVRTFDLDQEPASRLLQFDVVEFIGGNPFYLLDSIRKHNAAPILQEIAEKNVLIGWSAAAFVFGPTLSLVNLYSPELNFLNLTDLAGLALTQLQVLPHYSKFLSKIAFFEETCAEYEQQNNITVYRMNDGEGIVTDGSAITFLGDQIQSFYQRSRSIP